MDGSGWPLAMTPSSRQAEFEALVRRHLAWLYRQAYRYTGHREDAEDLVQELLARLYRNPGKFPQMAVPRAWLMKALHNLFVDQWRHRRRTPLGHLHPEPWEVLLENQPGGNTPEDAVAAAGLERDIVAALYSLGHEQRALLVLHDVEGHGLQELSETLGLPVGTLKSRLFRARRQLRIRLGEGNPSAPRDVIVTEVR